MALITVLQFLLAAALVIYLTINHLHLVRVKPVGGPLAEAPMVSVCVPARNEERGLEACLTSLLQQDYPHFEVIAVDDNSTDATAAIIGELSRQESNFIPVAGQPLPAGWCGKPFALHQAVQRARGEILMFTDADPVFKPWALTSAVFTLQVKNLDFLSLMPAAEFGSFWERVVQPVIFGLIAAKTRFAKANDDAHPHAMGFGAFIMIRKNMYARIGGHASLKDVILEDIGLARLAKKNGARCLVADAKELFSIRMYHSLREIWIGWRKNIYLAFHRSAGRTLAHGALLIGFLFTPYLVVAWHLWAASPWIWQALAWAALLLVLAAETGLCDELGLSRWTLLWFPLGAWIAVAIMFNSMLHIRLSGHSEWRGRKYPQPT
ncbi:MAG: glycosyltransferase [Nitrospinaceae bacterium]